MEIDATKATQLKRRVGEWIYDAACTAHDPRLWDVDNSHGWLEAITICRSCPVAQQCLDDALGDPTADGVYAGVVLEHGKPMTRHKITRRRNLSDS